MQQERERERKRKKEKSCVLSRLLHNQDVASNK